DLADQFQFKELIERQARLLSGGYARRVEIAKALIAKPAFILLDEPSTGLDPKSRLDLFAWLRSIQKENGTTVVWISHLTDEVQRMDRVVMLHQGHVVCDGQPSQLIGQLQYFYISAKLKDASVVERLETVAENVSLQGEDLQLRINKSDLELVISFLVPCVEHFMYREANLEDVYLEKTGVPIL
ncbi:MAG: ATP-binding cassette domain-containing protein, partial [Deltaproteobacteria bacterium]|nr:ATP-binding cassette domain-containing protein [Deltaproteobacteria bacterium]